MPQIRPADPVDHGNAVFIRFDRPLQAKIKRLLAIDQNTNKQSLEPRGDGTKSTGRQREDAKQQELDGRHQRAGEDEKRCFDLNVIAVDCHIGVRNE